MCVYVRAYIPYGTVPRASLRFQAVGASTGRALHDISAISNSNNSNSSDSSNSNSSNSSDSNSNS